MFHLFIGAKNQSAMRYPVSGSAYSDELRAAIGLFESGLYEQAGIQFLAILQKNPGDRDAIYFLRLVERRLARNQILPAATLIWQFDPKGSWERDWLHTLLAGTWEKEVVDNTWSQLAPVMIVVDNRLVEAKVDYYRRAFEASCRVILVHLSDETFRDDHSAYRYCDGVIRNYHSELLADSSRTHFIPLGYKAGFARDAHVLKATADRKYLWSFAGDAKKLTRKTMLDAMTPLGNGFQHLTSGFDTDDALSIDAYRALLDETVVVPCPGGWSNLETFRVYEALEAGCIPIVEKRPGFDYFTALLGPHPMPTVMTWAEGAEVIRRLKNAGELETLRRACSDWWRAAKPAMAQSTVQFLQQALRRG